MWLVGPGDNLKKNISSGQQTLYPLPSCICVGNNNNLNTNIQTKKVQFVQNKLDLVGN